MPPTSRTLNLLIAIAYAGVDHINVTAKAYDDGELFGSLFAQHQ